MGVIDTSLLKFTWKGVWTTQVVYSKNDVVQYDNSSYVCIKDIPRDYEIAMDVSVSTENYRTNQPKLMIIDKRPDLNPEYWKQIARAFNFKRGWMPYRTYKPGDVVRVGGDLYLCKVGGVRNTWVEDTTYWTQIFQNVNQSLKRNYMVSYPNNSPLGWTRNNGDHPTVQTCDGYMYGVIDALGNCMSTGGWGNGSSYNVSGRGFQGGWTHQWVPSGFSFVDWMRSSQVRPSLNIVLSNIGLPTPDGKTPRCIQWVKNYWQALFLFNNGEVYASGYNGEGSLGDNSTTNRSYPVRCTNQSTVGWIGETLQKSFNQTKIIKVDISNNGIRGTQNTTSCFALGDDGSLWSWGYNAFGQLGHGQSTTVSGDQFNNKLVPTRIPATFFQNKRVMDFMLIGNQYTSVLAIDEDGDLWGWGCNYTGELGLGDSNNVTNVHPIPTKIGYNWKKHGGIKKMTYYHHSTSGERGSYILCNDGSLIFAGRAQQGLNPTIHLIGGANTQRNFYRWTKFTNTGPGQLEIDNFWVVGDIAHTMYVRQRDTGLTFAAGDSFNYNLGQQANHGYWWYSGGMSGSWGLVEGVKNLVHVTNTMYEAGATTTANVYKNPILITEEGRAWASGRNTYGGSGLGWSGVSNDPTDQNPETGGDTRLFQPMKLPANTRIAGAMGQGSSGADLNLVITDQGKALVCGCDNENRSIAAYTIQGSPYGRTQGFIVDRHTLHGIISD